MVFHNKESFIKFKHKDIMIGDLVASTYLRENPKYGGELNYSFNLFKIFFY